MAPLWLAVTNAVPWTYGDAGAGTTFLSSANRAPGCAQMGLTSRKEGAVTIVALPDHALTQLLEAHVLTRHQYRVPGSSGASWSG